MNTLTQMLAPIPLPPMIRIRQSFDASRLEDPAGELRRKLADSPELARIQPGQQIAVVAGSRGIANLAAMTKELVEAIRARGAEPFLVPGMGSHGGATAEGQQRVLEHLGISEASMGVPIRSSMDVVEVDRLENGLPVYADALAAQADGIVVINRIKPHTAFRGRIESGLMKMIAIGLGKQKGAEACHQLGFKYMAENVPKMANILIQKLPILFGVGIVENAYDQTCRIEVVAAAEMEAREPELLEEAKSRMPRIPFEQLDVLIIDYIGKNISGDGMDPNITGRYPTPYAHGGPDVSKMVVLDLTAESHGNANGVGTADFTTRRLVDKTDWPATYANGLTSTVCAPTKMATVLENDRDAIKAAIKTCNILDYTTCRLARIRDTLHLGELEISLPLLEEARRITGVEIVGVPYEWTFDADGYLTK
ncbi:DUF2088 domain-containing protein [Xylanibacillus composti]|uniref:LarA-like N-terminal domain-containing protein n=1 Tax=Xylanibacillus composti TaxID=1572762 RepID=A0A8J4H3F5_9BACL|nr:lactate racemase domain-containing protein [Xylanibacillus composti]MDT9726020.1 DUF2088 domain-containing protein [Xylanibacillus composti]GIQ68836.1 hypothetical protein XYCOK13_16600 [Xylanibacillus composti]